MGGSRGGARGGPGIGRNALAALVADALIDALVRFGHEGLAPFLVLWDAFDAFRGEPGAAADRRPGGSRQGDRHCRGRAPADTATENGDSMPERSV